MTSQDSESVTNFRISGCLSIRDAFLFKYWHMHAEEIADSLLAQSKTIHTAGAPNDNFRKNICSEDNLRSRIFGTDNSNPLRFDRYEYYGVSEKGKNYPRSPQSLQSPLKRFFFLRHGHVP